MNKRIILSILLLAGIAAGTDAQTIHGKAHNEHDRIAEGVRGGAGKA